MLMTLTVTIYHCCFTFYNRNLYYKEIYLNVSSIANHGNEISRQMLDTVHPNGYIPQIFFLKSYICKSYCERFSLHILSKTNHRNEIARKIFAKRPILDMGYQYGIPIFAKILPQDRYRQTQ